MHQNRKPRGPGSRWQSLEVALWILLVLLAALLRLTDLDAAPLSSAEAVQALAAYRLAHPSASLSSPPSVPPSPLLLHLNALLFALFHGGDSLARLVPALAGVGLVLTPLLLRRYLGAWGTLGMGLLLALSPTAVLFSRTLDGTIPAALGVMVLVGCAARYLDSMWFSWVAWGGIGLAVALTAGPGAWGLLLGLLLAVAGGLWIWREQVPWIWPMVRPALRRGAAVAGLGVLAIGTGLGLHPVALADAGQAVLAWLARFGPTGDGSPTSPLLLLVAYEPLLLLAGLAGLMLAVRRRHGMGLLWIFWAAVGAAQLALMPGREPADLVWLLLPLAGLGGLAVDELARSLLTQGRWLNEGLYLPVSLLLWTHSGLSLARYARLGGPKDLALAGLALLLQAFLTATFGFAVSAPGPGEDPSATVRRGMITALRAGAVSLGLVLLLVTWSIGWRLSHRLPADPRELLVESPTGVEVRVLVDVVGQTSMLNTGGEAALPVTFLGEADPAVAWALRRFEQEVESEGLYTRLLGGDDPNLYPEGVDRPPLIVAPADKPIPAGYFGEVFILRRAWSPLWGGHRTARWWLYRESVTPPVAVEQVTLWVRDDLATANP